MKHIYSYEEFVNKNLNELILESKEATNNVINVRVNTKEEFEKVFEISESYTSVIVCPTMYKGWTND